MKINGFEVEAGCLIDGHWGQYGPDRLVELAEAFGMPLSDGVDPRHWRKVAERHDDVVAERGTGAEFGVKHAERAWDQYHWLNESVESWLEDHAEGCIPTWHDGEFFILAPDDELFDQ